MCSHLGDEKGARELLALLEPYSGRNVVTPGVAYLGPVDRYLGLLATVAGDHDQATAWFASARALAGAMGARPTCARLALDEAEALRERDPARSAALAAEAASEADELGLEALAERARALPQAEPTAQPAAPPPPPRPPAASGASVRPGR